MDCDSFDNYHKDICVKKRLKEHCDMFGGVVHGEKCKVGKFPMAVSDAVFEHKPRFQEHILMSPQEFLDATPPTDFRRENVEKLKDSLKNKDMDVLFLDVDIGECQVLDHEGRNRAKAAAELGIDKVPVVIFKKEFDPEATGFWGSKGVHLFSEDKMKCTKFKRQAYK